MLQESKVGLIILTPENVTSQWIMFEAGAISRSVEQSRVCPILFGIRKTDLEGPLSFFQAAEFDREDFRRVVNTINKTLEKSLPEQTLDMIYAKWWPQLEADVKAIMEKEPAKIVAPSRSDRELLEDILLNIRALSRQQEVPVVDATDDPAALEVWRARAGWIHTLLNVPPTAQRGILPLLRAPLLRHIAKTAVTDVTWEGLGCPTEPGQVEYKGMTIPIKQSDIDEAKGDPSASFAVCRFDPPSGPVSYYLDYLGVKRSQ